MMVISNKAGAHRFTWDLHYDPVTPEDLVPQGDDEATGAVPHRTGQVLNTPWAPPGSYTVKLTVDGKSYAQPLTLKLDPRVKTSPVALAQLATLSREMYDGAVATHRAFADGRAMVAQLAKMSGADVDAIKAKIEAVAPAQPRVGRGGRRRGPGGAAASSPSLETVSNSLQGAAMGMQGADVAPTAVQIAACATARKLMTTAMPEWASVKAAVVAFNAKRKAAGQPTVDLPK
jgi:hypothetical protein